MHFTIIKVEKTADRNSKGNKKKAIRWASALCIGVLSAFPLLAKAEQSQAISQSVPQIAEEVTVRIEGATLGSGVLIDVSEGKYKVLTAWHVVKGQKVFEELYVVTHDGRRHLVQGQALKQINNVDLSLIEFDSSATYNVARLGQYDDVGIGDRIFVAGYPLPSSQVPERLLRFVGGELVAKSQSNIPLGYGFLYSNPTFAGMSGGPVFDLTGKVVGIHGRTERDDIRTLGHNKIISTGVNQGIPISHYHGREDRNSERKSETLSVMDMLVRIASLRTPVEGSDGRIPDGIDQEVIELSNKILSVEQNADAYFYRALHKSRLGQIQEAFADYDKALGLRPGYSDAIQYKAYLIWEENGDIDGAVKELMAGLIHHPWDSNFYWHMALMNQYNDPPRHDAAIQANKQGLEVDPRDSLLLSQRCDLLVTTNSDKAIEECSKAIQLNPGDSYTYVSRADALVRLQRYSEALNDYSSALLISPEDGSIYELRADLLSDLGEWRKACDDYAMAIKLGSEPNYKAMYNIGCQSLKR